MTIVNSIASCIAVTATVAASSLCFSADVTFERDVAPILQRRCLGCHNARDSKGDFSLETAESVFESGYIEPGDSASSHLQALITPKNGKAEMPQESDPLALEEIAVIRRWIDQGAGWPKGFRLQAAVVTNFDWWSYRPLNRPKVPEPKSDWGRTEIDEFVLDQMINNGLAPSPEADRRTLIRRLTYDLIGLPPTPQQVDAFVNDHRANAYIKLVDRLLASPHYGERWARHWLDVVKYADTCGYDKDKLRPNAWPYRDYVVGSFNNDKPYSKFVQEQVAGDVLFPGTPDGILGLGFLAAGPWDFIGHVEVPESKIDGMVARNLDRDDMVSNSLNTFCSVTVQCARCHNHKFDPISQDHYYGLQSIFAAVDKAERSYDLDPTVQSKRTQLTTKLDDLRKEESAAAKEVADLGGAMLVKLQSQIAELKKQQVIMKDPAFGYHSKIAKKPGAAAWVEVDLGGAVDVSTIVLNPCHDDFGGIGGGFGFPVRFRIEVTVNNQWELLADHTHVDFPNPGLIPLKIPALGRSVRYIRVTATQLAERNNDFIFALAELQALTADGKNVAAGAVVSSLDSIEAPVRWGRRNLTDGEWARVESPSAARKLAMLVAERNRLTRAIVTPKRSVRDAEIRKEISEVERQLALLPSGRMVYAATTNFPVQGNFKPTKGVLRDVQVLHRGDVNQPLKRAVPGFLPLGNSLRWQVSDSTEEKSRRAALAKWLTHKDHPLVWRSIVNRIWQYHFGKGLVATPNDFGRMGAQPTHPKLLDWLASEFRDNGQSFKKLHRLIVTSSVYRQSSDDHPGHAAIDGSNQFLWRMNRRRLSAEEVRDSVLSVSGALNKDMGGPGFYLFKLEKPEHSPHFQYHKFDANDPASHRRSIYRFIVRSQPDPWMTTLDCADSSQSTPRRNETLTSLQALSLLNNQFSLVMAERFADRLTQQTLSLPEQIEFAFQLLVQREMTDAERQPLVEYAKAHGLKNLCRVLFNLSEFVFLD